MTTVSPASPEAMAVWLADQRWYHGGEGASAATTVTQLPLPITPAVSVAIVDAGEDDRYQLLVPAEDLRPVPDLGDDAETTAALVAWIVASGDDESTASVEHVSGHWLSESATPGRAPARPLRGEQSNTSTIVGGTHVLKVFRRLQPGVHPEIEMGRHLAAMDAAGTPSPVAPLCGWYQIEPASASSDEPTVLGVVQELVPGALDAWALTLSGLAGDPGALLHRLHDLGGAVAALHLALARPSTEADTDTDPEAPGSFGTIALDAARIEAVVAAVGADATTLLASGFDRPDDLAALVGRAPDVAALATTIAARLGDDLGSAIRHHGDLHLGQVVLGDDGWVILDFEGEPARPLAQRRRRHSPLRDVAGMIRSFAYAAATHRRSGASLADGWEPAARAAFLDGYLAVVDPELLPRSAAATRDLLRLFELEKVLYEIGYELAHRPDWVHLPVGGLRTLMAEEAP